MQHAEQACFVQQCLEVYARHLNRLNISREVPIEQKTPACWTAVTEEAVLRAETLVPASFGVHKSQEDGDEGDEDRVPSWRQEQLNKIKSSKHRELAWKAPTAPVTQRALKKEQEEKLAKQEVEGLVGELLTRPDATVPYGEGGARLTRI